MRYRTFPPLALLVHHHLQNHQQGSLSSQGDAAIAGRLGGPFLPILGDGFWRSGLAKRQGVSETAGAQIGFAKCLITGPGIVPTIHMGVLSRTSPVITASPFCPGPFSPDQGGIPP